MNAGVSIFDSDSFRAPSRDPLVASPRSETTENCTGSITVCSAVGNDESTESDTCVGFDFRRFVEKFEKINNRKPSGPPPCGNKQTTNRFVRSAINALLSMFTFRYHCCCAALSSCGAEEVNSGRTLR